MASLDQLMEFLEELKIEIADLKAMTEGDLVVSASQIQISTLSELVAGEAGIPTGGKAIVAFTVSCPDGWTRVSALDSKFMRGATSYGGTGGGTHSHTGVNSHGHTGVGNHDHSYTHYSNRRTDIPGSGSYSMASDDAVGATTGGGGAHSHPAYGSGLSNETSEPPYVNVIFCMKD